MRCLYCGKRLALLSKLTNGEFCSAAHRKRYQEDQDRLALARLIAEPQRVARSGLQIPGPAGFVTPPPQRVSGRPGVGFHRLPTAPAAADLQLSVVVIEDWPRTVHPPLCLPCALELALAPAMGAGQAAEDALALVGWERNVARLGAAVGLTGGEMPVPEQLGLLLSPREEPRTACEPVLAAVLGRPAIGLHTSPAHPHTAFGAVLEHRLQPSPGRPQPLETVAQPASADAGVCWSNSTRGLLRTTGFPDELTRLPEQMPWGGLALPEAIRDLKLPRIPASATPFETPLAGLRSGLPQVSLLAAGAAASADRPAAGELGRREQVVAQYLSAPAAALPLAVAPQAAGALPLAAGETLSLRASQGNWDVRSEVVDERVAFRAPAPPRNGLVPTAVLASLAAQVDSDVRWADSQIAPAGPLWLPDSGQTPTLPAPPTVERCTGSLAEWHEQGLDACAPAAPESVPDLASHSLAPATRCECGAPSGGEIPLAPRLATGREIPARNWNAARAQMTFATTLTSPVRPRARLETVAPGCEQPVATPLLAEQSSHWGSAKRFWNTAPADLKWLTLALPVILAVALFSSTPTGRSEKFASGGRGTSRIAALRAVQDVVQARWENLRENIISRAAISLQDDFRSGLSSWQGRGDWARGWSYDPAGFVRSGSLALYRPSMRLADYRLEFLGQIERKSIGWVFRAVDLDNYYATKISVLKPGPLPTVAIVHYAVIDGREQERVQTPLPITVRNDMLYRVRVEVRGQNFTTSVQGQVVDFWSDDRLTRGGVGFFSAKGEQARLRWIEVSHQYDALGRLCAYLAPYSIQSASGSLNQ